MSAIIEELKHKLENGDISIDNLIQDIMSIQRKACQRIVEDYGSHSELDSIEQLYEAVGNAEIDESDYIESTKKNFILVRNFDTQPLLTVQRIELAYEIVEKMKPWTVDIIALDVEHFSYIPDNEDIERIAKVNGYISPITNVDYE